MQEYKSKFPNGFLWGSATSSFQVEGDIKNCDWYEAGLAKRVPLADSGPDHHIYYEKDFDIAAALGQNSQRISIEWSKIEPQEGQFDNSALEHYRKVLMAIRQRKMEPFVTIWHFSLPSWFSQKGGFTSKDAPKIFTRYAKFVVDGLGDLCKNFSTINEPEVYASNSYYRGVWPPFTVNAFKAWKTFNQLAKSHILAYKEIKKDHSEIKIGLVKDNIYFITDKVFLSKTLSKFLSWFWNRLFINKCKGFFDNIGVNYYFTKKIGIVRKVFPQSDMGWNLFAEGLYHILMELSVYNVPVYVTEVGIADEKDSYRAQYIEDLVYWTHKAIENGVDVRGFMYWSLLDNYEWAYGYEKKFGLVSYDVKTKERSIRPSAYKYKEICENNGIIK